MQLVYPLALIFLFRLSLRYFASMVGCPHPSKPLITFETLTVFKRFLMKAQCVTYYGLIQMIGAAGGFHLGVLAIHLAR